MRDDARSEQLLHIYTQNKTIAVVGASADTSNLLQDIEDLYQQEKISQRVYVKAKLLLRAYEPPKRK